MNAQFTTKCAVERGIQVARREAPLFAQHLESEKARMERIAQETAQLNFPHTAEAMKRFAEGVGRE